MRLTQQDFIERATKTHGNKYDYSLVEYESSKKHVNIICPKHGIFSQQPTQHIFGHGCRKCLSDRQKIKVDDFIKRCCKKHNNKYSYCNIFKNNEEFANLNELIKVICPIHGEYLQKARKHLEGSGCHNCAKIQTKITKKENQTETGWGFTAWNKRCINNKAYLYIIILFNKNETFIKIGRTNNPLKRFRTFKMYYGVKEIKIIENTPKKVWNMEKLLQKQFKKDKYLPKIKFGGMEECFNITTLKEVEEFYEKMWNNLGCPYYELNEY